MHEIYQNGPVALNFQVVADTYQYKSGIYVPTVVRDSLEIKLE